MFWRMVTLVLMPQVKLNTSIAMSMIQGEESGGRPAEFSVAVIY